MYDQAKQHKQDKDMLQGLIERVTFHNEDTGFFVVKVKAKKQRDLITVIGKTATIQAGECVECTGVWINNSQYGLQFKAEHAKILSPDSLKGIEKYLSSGMIKGIGPYFAKKMIQTFAEKVFDVIEKTPNRLMQIEGIGEKRKQLITSNWSDQKKIKNIMVFLHTYGVSGSRSVRIYKTYGDQAINIIKGNPYRLALDIHGVGFKTADELALKLDIQENSLLRAQAGVYHVLTTICQQGHCASTREELIQASHQLLNISESIIEQAIQLGISENQWVEELINEKRSIYLMPLYIAETKSSERLKHLNSGKVPWGDIDITKAIAWAEQKTQLRLSASQNKAIATILQHKISIITGGPGVGKTTIINTLIKIIQVKRLSIALSAPTGRAAKRLTETTGLVAKTIHRLLDFKFKGYGFKYNEHHSLPIDLLIVDEASMLDILLFHHLIKAIPSHAALIFVGDIDQLPSVGSGAVLSDLIRSKTIHTVRLTEIFRQAHSSHIILNAHRINEGKMPLPNYNDKKNDFFTIYADDPIDIHSTLIALASTRLPCYYQCDPLRDIQILTPMRRGLLGSIQLNLALQKSLNKTQQSSIQRFGITYAPGDKIIQITNNYDKDIYNGDIGFIKHIQLEQHVVLIQFDQRIIPYDFNELDEIELAYAISIHKSQGSEFPFIILPIVMQHYTLLARNLLYTGITRGKQLVVLIGQKKAIGMAIHNNKANTRLTHLAQRMRLNLLQLV